ncbi:hypothetical protein GGI25_005511 [Coemansia spiralis]|uniref:Glucosidase 2 subunit beta n=2 Tax=Coemansia TaxID=4863 RepID=A0A9W8FYI6_9FUNG|nr:hypothetical protein EDC05_005563 [Coemansia umbellata]KAJ2619529.1 hypothetical protein GGI26_005767 [Coemansia sp. RSA 1358]KAJ2671393.1 hypothetical protein GGI25_005511 [Coemansia spiralis]
MSLRSALTLGLLAIHFSHAAQAQKEHTLRGVDPARAHHYQPNAQGNFQCLDKSLDIPFAQVNDDYCDCPDGSDEPGTSACNNATFYCANRGHIPGRLSSTRVNDGVCDYDVCCDGSDEWESSICPDRCAEMGSEHRRKAMEMERVQRAGSQKRMELIREAKELRQAKTKELAQKDSELAELTAKVENAEKRKLELEEKQRVANDASEKSHELRKQKLQDEYLGDMAGYRKLLGAELHQLRAHRDTLVLMLRSVRESHNKEYNDGAVIEALDAYAKFVDASPYIEQAAMEYADEDDRARRERQQQMDRDNEAQDDISVDACKTAIEIFENELETLNDDINMLFGILDKLRTGYDKNYHDLAVKAADVGLREFEEARKSDLAEIAEHQESNKIDTLRLRVQEAMAKHGELGTSNSSEDHDENGGNDSQLAEQLASARTEFWDLQSSLTRLNNEVSQLRELLERDLGPDDMYLAAKGACYSLDAGEYTYELCLLDRASQISKKDGSRQGLGSFDGFGDDSLDYTVLRFAHGTKCWNGPERSITASFTCAEEIKVVSVSEPEKCEYSAKMTGPFACPLAVLGEDEAQKEHVGDRVPVVDGPHQHSDAERIHDEL